MKLQHLFLALFALVLAAVAFMAGHYRASFQAAQQQLAQLNGTGPRPAMTAPTPAPVAPAAAEPSLDDRARQLEVDNARLRAEAAEQEAKVLAGGLADKTNAAAAPPQNPTQSKIANLPSIAKIKSWHPQDGFAVLDQGSNVGLATKQEYALRRQNYIIARVTIGDTVEGDQCIADVEVNSVQPGVEPKPGDEVIKWD
jgi:hypothetical protein